MFALTLMFVVVSSAGSFAQFGLSAPSAFVDPDGFFSLQVPAGWTYQADDSEAGFALFYGPGSYDLFYVEMIGAGAVPLTPEAQARAALEQYAGRGLSGFRIVSQPASGTLSGREASFIVYSYVDSSGIAMTEGRAFVISGSDVYTIAFADAADRFDDNVAVFNSVLNSFALTAPASPVPGAAGFGAGVRGTGTAASAAPAPPFGAASGAGFFGSGSYTDPGGRFSMTVPDGWELWEEQWTGRGDAVEPWHSLLDWPGKPMSKTLFIWDFFDEWLQTGAQYEIVAAVIDDVPGTQADAVEQLVNAAAGSQAATYEGVTRRVRLGAEAAFAVKIGVRPGRTALWSEGPPWHRDITFFMLKRDGSLFVLAVPDAIVDGIELTEVLESFAWHAR